MIKIRSGKIKDWNEIITIWEQMSEYQQKLSWLHWELTEDANEFRRKL